MKKQVLLVYAAFSLSIFSSLAQVLVTTKGNAPIQAISVEAEIARETPDAHATIRGDARAVTKILDQIHVYRALSTKARAANFDRSPLVAAAEQNAIEKELGTRYINFLLDQADISNESLIEAARETYSANQSKYRLPESFDAAHILLAFKDYPNKEAAYQEADKFVSRLRSGASFSEIAKKYSSDNGSRDRGGELGVFNADDVTREFRAALLQLKTPGDISAPTHTPFGLHIIRLNKREKGGVKPFTEVKDDIVKELRENRRQSKREEILAEIRLDPTLRVDDSAFEKFTGAKKIK